MYFLSGRDVGSLRSYLQRVDGEDSTCLVQACFQAPHATKQEFQGGRGLSNVHRFRPLYVDSTLFFLVIC